MLENINFESEVEIKNFNYFTYDNFIKKSVDIYISSNLSKKGRYKLKQLITDNSFYPVHIIKLNKNDSEKTKIKKLEQLKLGDKQLFFKRYYQILMNQYNINDKNDLLPVFIKHIKQCPFCKKGEFSLIHDYSIGNCQDVNIIYKCVSCNEEMITQSIYQAIIFDAAYLYNERIKFYMDEYVKVSPNGEFLLEKIFNEFKFNTEIRSFLFC